MDFLSYWLQGIVIAVIITTIIELILPNSNSKKYIKVVLGVYVVFNIITPIVNQFFDSNFELSSIVDVDEYMKKMELYEVDNENKNIDKTNEENIKNIYISNLENDMKAKLKDKGYMVENVEFEIENTDTYEIQSVNIILKKNEKQEMESNTLENKVIINEVEKVEIEIGENTKGENLNYINERQDKQKNDVTEKEKKEIKEYLKSVYEIKEIIIN